jgi:DNA-directed RNA polymerase specialized sigma24 family protein
LGQLRGGWTESWIDDVVQDALLDIVRSVHGCRATSEREVRAWVAAIGRRRIRNLFREESHGRVALPLDDAHSLTAPGSTPPSPPVVALERWDETGEEPD